MEQKIWAYCRVSSQSQHEDRQLAAMKEFGVEDRRIFVDKQTGSNFNRPNYRKMLKKLKKGDLVVVLSIDRLGRNYQQILEQWRILTKEKLVDIVVLDMPLLDTRKDKDLSGTLIADIILQLLSYVSETEHRNIRQRQAEGIKAARERGVRFGRPEKDLPGNFSEVSKRWIMGEMTIEEASKECGMAKTTFYVKARQLRTNVRE